MKIAVYIMALLLLCVFMGCKEAPKDIPSDTAITEEAKDEPKEETKVSEEAKEEVKEEPKEEEKKEENGMKIEDISAGTGEPVKNGDTVKVHYTGTLKDGTVFDSSKQRAQPFVFTVGEGRVIEGWEKGLVGMKVGGKRVLTIPPEMGYGDHEVGPIPANSTLYFEIELLAIN